MRFLPKMKLPKLSKTKSNKKILLGTLKGSSKWLGAGLLMGAGAEVASHISSKAQQADDGAQYVSITDWGPSLIRSDSVEASSDGSRRWLFGTRNPLTFGIPTFLIAILIILTCKFCWRRLVCFGGLAKCCVTPKDQGHTESPSAPTHSEAVDMEAMMERLDHDIHTPVAVEDESYYATPRRRLEETMKVINESAANRARLAHQHDSSLHHSDNVC